MNLNHFFDFINRSSKNEKKIYIYIIEFKKRDKRSYFQKNGFVIFDDDEIRLNFF